MTADSVRLEARKWAEKLRDGHPRRSFWTDASPALRVIVSQRIDEGKP